MKISKEAIRQSILEMNAEEEKLIAELNELVGVRKAFIGLLEMENIPETVEEPKESTKEKTTEALP